MPCQVRRREDPGRRGPLPRGAHLHHGRSRRRDFANRVLAKHWPSIPRRRDVRDVTAASVAERCGTLPSLVTGGFPCTQVSRIGKGAGLGTKEEPTEVSGLWWEMRLIVEEIRPAWVLAENVPALRTRGGDAVLSSLEELGYSCWPLVVGAWAVGATHKRNRVWLVAHDLRQRERGPHGEEGRRLRTGDGCQVPREDSQRARPHWLWPARPWQQQHGWEKPRLLEPGMGGPVDGPSRGLAQRRADELKAMANANPPQVAEVIGRAILRATENSQP